MTTTSIPSRVSERTTQTWLLLGLEVFLAVGATAGSIAMITGTIDASSYVEELPFSSTVFAGIALGLINGVLPIIVIVGALRQKRWASLGHVVVGGALMGWIVVQVAFIGPASWLQPFMFTLGLVIAGLGLHLHRQSGTR